MENENYTQPAAPAVLPIAIRYGLITGLVMIIFTLITFFIGMYGAWYLGLIGIVIVIVMIVAAHNHYKKLNGGYMSYGKGLGIGTLTYGIAGILAGIFIYIYLTYIDPSVLDTMIEAQVAMMENFNLPEDKMDEALARLENENTPGRHFINQAVGGFVIGFFLSLIIAAITKRNRPEFE